MVNTKKTPLLHLIANEPVRDMIQIGKNYAMPGFTQHGLLAPIDDVWGN